MKFSLFLIPCHHPRENPSLAFHRGLKLIQLGDKLGLDDAFIGEHQSDGWETIPAPEMTLSMAAANAHRINLGTSVFSTPFHHPFYMAEHMCFLDHLTRGRAIIGVGPCNLVTGRMLFNVAESKFHPKLLEAVEIIVKLLESDEPVTHRGEFWQFTNLRI